MKSSVAALVVRAILCGAATTILAAAPLTAVQAQGVGPQRAVAGIRMIGVWKDAAGLQYTIKENHMAKVTGVVTRPATGEVVGSFELSPHPDWGVSGAFTQPGSAGGVLSAYVDGAGGHIIVRQGFFIRYPEGTGLTLQRVSTPQDASSASTWSGTWRTSRGLVEIKPDDKNFYGGIYKGDPPVYAHGLALVGEGSSAYGAWEGEGTGDFSLQLSSDGKTFKGYYTDVYRSGGSRLEWTGEKIVRPTRPRPTASTSPLSDPPTTAPPLGSSSPAPAAPPAPTQSAEAPGSGAWAGGAASFQPLQKYAVRVDRVVAAPGGAQRVDVFMTLKNNTQGQLWASSGVVQVKLTDNQGVSKQNGQVLRPVEETQAHFGSTPVIEPGEELKVKFSFYPDAGTRPSRVTVIEGDKRAEFSGG